MKKINLIEWLWKTDSHEKQKVRSVRRYAAMLLLLLTCVAHAWATNFTNSEVLFIYTDTYNSDGGAGAWKDDACVKMWFNSSGSGGSTASTTWLFDNDGHKMFYTVVPSSGTLNQVQLQRFDSKCSGWWGGSSQVAHQSSKNTFYNYNYANDFGWKGNYSMYLKGSTDSWTGNLATFTQSSGTTFTASFEFTAAATSYEFRMCDSYGNWHGSNVSVTGLVAGATYRFTGTINLASGIGSLSMSKTQLTFAIATSATNGSVSPTSAFVGSSGVAFTATPSTGYHWSSWGTTSGLTATNANPTSLTATAAGTLTANFEENTYNLTFSHNGHGSISVGGAAVSSGSTAKVNYFTTKTLVATPSTGYNFSGWTKSGTNASAVTIGNASNASTTIKATNTGATVTAGFSAKTYSITLDDDGDYQGNGSATATYSSNSLSIASHASRTDYRIEGYFAPGTGDQVTDASGNLLANKTGNTGSGVFNITDASGNWVYDGDLTLYAHWIYDVTEYAVTFAVGTSYTSLGSLTAYNNTTSSAISSGANVRSGQSVTFTAAPNTGYAVEGWYTNAACTEGKHSAGNTTYMTSIGAATNVYVKFVEKTWSVAFAAGTGGTVTTPAATPQTVGQITGISIAATPATGYTFNSWSSSNGGSFTSGTSTNSNTFKPTANTTVTASFNETMRTITIVGGTAASTTAGVETTGSATAAAPAAGKKFTGWSLGAGVTLSGGSLTDRTINFTATANATVTATYADRAQVKMYFAKPTSLSWGTLYAYAWQNSNTSNNNKAYPGVELSTTEVINCVTYYVYQYYTEGDGIGGAATGNSAWDRIIFGCNSDDKKTGNLTISNGHYYYKTSSGTGKAAAITSAWGVKTSKDSFSGTNYITHNCGTNSGTVDISFTGGNNYTFKVYNEVNDQWWSNSTAMGSSNPVTASMAAAQTLYSNDANNMQVNAALTGSYTFIVGSTNASNPTIKVTFPEVYAVVGSFNSWNSETNPLAMDGNTGTADIVLAPSGSNYTLKVVDNGAMYGKNSTTITGTTTVSSLSTSDGNINLKADIYPASANPSYRFSYNKSTKALTVTYPAAHTVTYGVGTHAGTASVTSNISVASGKKILDAQSITFSKGSTNTGYTWKGWYNNAAGTGDALGTGDTYTSSSRAANTSVYACYNLVNYTITYNLNGGANPGGAPTGFTIESEAITLPTPTRTGYTFAGWKVNSDLSGDTHTTIPASSTGNKVYYAKWTPKTYTITLNQNGATTESTPTSLTATYDGKANGASDQFTLTNPEKTGYTFAGWYESEGGTGAEIITTAQYYKWEDNPYVTTTGLWQHDGDVTVYAKWTPNNYAVTLSTSGETGYGSSAPSNQTATYGTALPTITPPVGAAGYKFQGYYTGTNGSGTKYYNADGTSAANWNIAEATTLHAYFEKAEISSLTHATSVAKADVAYLVVNPTLSVEPENYTAICWTLHYAENDNVVDGEHYSVAAHTESGTKPNQVRFTLNNLAVGSYYVQAVLKASASSGFDACSTGDELDTKTGAFNIIGSSTVTILYKNLSTGDVIASSGSVEIEAGGSAGVKAPNIIGYSFNSWSLGAGVTNTCADGASCGTEKDSINISSPYDGVINAFYTKKQMIYFNNTLGWDTVYVYFYKDSYYWGSDNQGTGANTSSYGGSYTGKYAGMTKIGNSDIYYYDMTANSATSYTNVAFTEKDQNGADYFYNANKVIGRGDYKSSLSMYVPLANVTGEPVEKNEGFTAYYYEKGYWMNYPDNSGYVLKIYDNTTDGALRKEIKFPYTADKKMPMSITTDLEGNKTYGFHLYRADATTYGNTGTMTNGHSGDGIQGAWEFKSDVSNKAGLTTTSAGNYTFTLTYGLDLSSNYNYLVGVRYPESTGDFRVQYKDTAAGHTTWKTSVIIPAVTEADTVSYFVRSKKSPYIRVQTCTATYDEKRDPKTVVEWNNVNDGSDILPDTITKDGVYNFIFTKSGDDLVLSEVKPYEGNFYIRVDGAGSTNWDNYRAADHIMPFSEYSFDQKTDKYSHYFTKYYKTLKDDGTPDESKNIKFVVANDYSTNISDTIVRDGIADTYVDANGWLSGRNANIRFMYNYKTNVATRRYLDGAQEDDSEFLLLIPSNNTSIYDVAEGGSGKTQVKFSDNGNWIYEANVYVVPGTTYKLKSSFGIGGGTTIVQYLKGAESGAGEYETLIGGSGSRLKIRLLYDFKTNRVIAAYVPSNNDEISGDNAINADIMFMREHQGDVTQITFATNESKISAIQNVYSVLKFNKTTINNLGLSRYERDLFYVSFPYNVPVSDIIGFGEYGKHWIIEYYDGAGRAEKGFWADSKSFWKFVTPAMKNSFTLQAGTGYIVALDLDEMETGDDIWENTDQVELIFPGDISMISDQEVTYTMPQHQCNIGPRFEGGDDRRIKDSHWNVLGVPTYHNTTGTFENHTDEIGGKSQVWSTDGKPNYLYTWNMTDNSLSVTNASGYNYKAMHAYIVQYYGDVTFHTSTNAAPSPIVARRTYAEKPIDVDFRLELSKNGVVEDQTFVSMTNDEEASAGFVFGEDLSKEFNSNRANIYTLVTSMLEEKVTITETAGNTLPMSEQTTVIPVGVKIAADGDYTFAIPEGTEGIGVTLIDNETGIRTSLSALEYTISLSAGTYDSRFVLEISPIQQMPTGVELLNGENGANGVRKVLIDGLLYIVKDGKMFDARGAVVK